VGSVLIEHLRADAQAADVPSIREDLTVEDVLAADAWARSRTAELVAAGGST